MLPAARKLWSRRESDDERSSCALSALERSVLRFHRLADVPGLEIPARYFQFVRTGDVRVIEGVLEHNRHDLISLAALTSRALQLAADGPETCESAGEQLGLGRIYEQSGDDVRATRAYELAASSGDQDVAPLALARWAIFLRREGRFDEAAAAWARVLECGSLRGRPLTTIERRAAEALAIHHEHRARDLDAARRYAETMRATAAGRFVADVEHRLGRLDRKMKAAEREKGSPQAAPLLD
jgi:tetratricopeptide (TPR) repeat protein